MRGGGGDQPKEKRDYRRLSENATRTKIGHSRKKWSEVGRGDSDRGAGAYRENGGKRGQRHISCKEGEREKRWLKIKTKFHPGKVS